MLEFLSTDVTHEFYSRCAQIYDTTKRILTTNPDIVKYWVHIRRDSFYRQVSRLKLKGAEDVWMKLLTRNDDISLDDIAQIYQFIRTSVHLVITNNYCTSPYYAQTKQNEDDEKTTTITLSGRLLQSGSYSFVFVAAAVLLRELTRAIWPTSLIYDDAKAYLRNPLFLSWTGIPLTLWPHYLRKQERALRNRIGLYYRTHPSDGIRSLVSDAGNLFQHVFYNGEVHLYDEFDERHGQVVTQTVIKTHDTQSALCAARYLNDQFLNNFFNIHQCSLDTIRDISDQTCPYYKYNPGKYDEITVPLVVTDTPITKRYCFLSGCYLPSRGPCYKYKPYHFYEPRQFYEQTYYSGHPSCVCPQTCWRIDVRYIRTNDPFFVENRSLFRLAESLPSKFFWADDEIKDEILVARPPRYHNDDLDGEMPSQIEEERIIIPTWRLWLTRIQNFFNKLTNEDNKSNKNKI